MKEKDGKVKKRLKIFLICVFMTLIVLLPIKSKQINDEMPDAYVNILSEYERVMNDKTYSR